jgi:hypothetical protein
MKLYSKDCRSQIYSYLETNELMKISLVSKIERKVLRTKMEKRGLKIYVSKISKFTDDPEYDMDNFIKGIRFWIRISD